MELATVKEELASGRFSQDLYEEALQTVRRVAISRRYPPDYSPTGSWDDHGLRELADDWIVDKLLRRGHLAHLLQANTTMAGLRRGLEWSFTDFLIGRKKRTVLDNLFGRAYRLLEADERFRVAADAPKKATRCWALAAWDSCPEPYQGPDDPLIAAGLRLRDYAQIRYRGDARKLSPVLSDPDLARFLAALLAEVGLPVSLGQIMLVIKYRFGLLADETTSLEEPAADDGEGHTLARGDFIPASGETPEAALLLDEAAQEIVVEMSDRQRECLLAYARGETYAEAAARLGCSTSTVEKNAKDAVRLLRDRVGGETDVEPLFSRVLEMLDAGQARVAADSRK